MLSTGMEAKKVKKIKKTRPARLKKKKKKKVRPILYTKAGFIIHEPRNSRILDQDKQVVA